MPVAFFPILPLGSIVDAATKARCATSALDPWSPTPGAAAACALQTKGLQGLSPSRMELTNAIVASLLSVLSQAISFWGRVFFFVGFAISSQ